MQRIKEIFYIIMINLLIILFALSLAANVFELFNKIYRIIATMLTGILTFLICKDVTKILIKEVKDVPKNEKK